MEKPEPEQQTLRIQPQPEQLLEPQSQPQPEHRPEPPREAQPDHAGLQVVYNSGLEVVPPQSYHYGQPAPNYDFVQQQQQWEKTYGAVAAPAYSPPAVAAAAVPVPAYTPPEGGAAWPSGAPYGSQRRQAPAPPADGNSDGAEKKDAKRPYCGLGRQSFVAVLLILVFIAVMATALGVGLGIGLNRTTGGEAAASTNATDNDTPTTTTVTNTPAPYPTGTLSLPPPAATATLTPTAHSGGGGGVVGWNDVVCPADNRTVYAANFSKAFMLLCGRDYNSNAGATDMTHKAVSTAGECIQTCANNTGCVGAGWGSYLGVETCWLKSALGEPNPSTGWYFAVRVA